MTRFVLACTCAFAMLLTTAFVRAADENKSSSSNIQETDKCFIEGAAVSNMFEQKLSEVAVQQASDQQVKQFAQQMVDDHKKASDQNKQVADKIGAQVPSDLPQMKQKEIDAIKSLQGKDFDQAYLSAMKAAHLHDVSCFEDEAQISKNDDVKQFARQLLPTLQQHERHVMRLAQAQGLPTRGNMAREAGARMERENSDQSQQKSNSSSSGTSSGDTNSR